ncbi:MAG: hypothetical protein MK212_14800 [Saprospiraceae bacterium]|nr:hypothetical protein [Saprospiraceae bacterium]
MIKNNYHTLILMTLANLSFLACGGGGGQEKGENARIVDQEIYKSTLQFDYSQIIKERLKEVEGGLLFYKKVDAISKENKQLLLGDAVCEVCKKENAGIILLQLLNSLDPSTGKTSTANQIDQNCKKLKKLIEDKYLLAIQGLENRYHKVDEGQSNGLKAEMKKELQQFTIYTHMALPEHKPEKRFEIWETYTSQEFFVFLQKLANDTGKNPLTELIETSKLVFTDPNNNYVEIASVGIKDTAEVTNALTSAFVSAFFPKNLTFYWSKSQTEEGIESPFVYLYAVRKDRASGLLINNEDVVDASMFVDSMTMAPNLSIVMDQEGTRKLEELTGRNINRNLTICVDNIVYSAPKVLETIAGGRLQITGFVGESKAEVSQFGAILSAGALPSYLQVIKTEKVMKE